MPVRLSTGRVLPWLLIIAAGGVAAALRFFYIEPAAIGDTCTANGTLWWCGLRTLVVEGFYYGIYGWLAFAAAIASIVVKRRWLAVLAAALGAFAMVLYCVELGAFALLVGILRLARLQAGGSPVAEDRHGQHQVHAAP